MVVVVEVVFLAVLVAVFAMAFVAAFAALAFAEPLFQHCHCT